MVTLLENFFLDLVAYFKEICSYILIGLVIKLRFFFVLFKSFSFFRYK